MNSPLRPHLNTLKTSQKFTEGQLLAIEREMFLLVSETVSRFYENPKSISNDYLIAIGHFEARREAYNDSLKKV